MIRTLRSLQWEYRIGSLYPREFFSFKLSPIFPHLSYFLSYFLSCIYRLYEPQRSVSFVSGLIIICWSCSIKQLLAFLKSIFFSESGRYNYLPFLLILEACIFSHRFTMLYYVCISNYNLISARNLIVSLLSCKMQWWYGSDETIFIYFFGRIAVWHDWSIFFLTRILSCLCIFL